MFTVGYACPDSGVQNVVSLGLDINGNGGATVNLAIYSADGSTLIAEGTSEKAGTADGWLEWTNAELTWHSGTALTGGTTYRFGLTWGTDPRGMGTQSRPSGSVTYVSGDNTSGFPASMSGSAYTWEYNVRCGVEPAGGGGGGGGSVYTLYYDYRRRRI